MDTFLFLGFADMRMWYVYTYTNMYTCTHMNIHTHMRGSKTNTNTRINIFINFRTVYVYMCVWAEAFFYEAHKKTDPKKKSTRKKLTPCIFWVISSHTPRVNFWEFSSIQTTRKPRISPVFFYLLCICKHVYIHLHIQIYWIYIYMYMYMHTQTYTYIRVYIRLHIQIYWIYIYVCVYIDIYI